MLMPTHSSKRKKESEWEWESAAVLQFNFSLFVQVRILCERIPFTRGGAGEEIHENNRRITL